MKKSNKLLSGGFLTGLLLITIMHVTLYAKYRNGNYTIYNVEDELTTYSMQSFPHILFVSVRNLPEATVKFGDVAQVGKGEEDTFDYVQKGDTLLIAGRDSARGRQIGHRTVLSLPYNVTLSVYNSSLFFSAGKKTAGNNPVIYLQKAQAYFSGDKTPLQLSRVKIVASDSSAATFHGNVQVADLYVQLSNSSFEYAEGDLGQLSIETDPVSRISLQSKHLSKAKISTITHE